MKIKELLKNIKPLEIVGDADVDITGVNIDSRRIENGHLFVAMKGTGRWTQIYWQGYRTWC